MAVAKHGQQQDVGKAAPPNCILPCACGECSAGYVEEPGTSTTFESDCLLHHPDSMPSYKLPNQEENIKLHLNLECCTENEGNDYTFRACAVEPASSPNPLQLSAPSLGLGLFPGQQCCRQNYLGDGIGQNFGQNCQWPASLQRSGLTPGPMLQRQVY